MAGGIAASDDAPGWHKVVGISLAVSSSLFIGASFVLKKKGLLDTMKETPGSGHAYLKSPMWWVGMILMLGGEVFNVAAYAFSPASLVTPLGAMSVVISAVLSSIFLKERLSFSAKIGCLQCVIGSIIIVLFSPESSHSNTIPEFVKNIINPVFLTYSGIMIAFLVVLMAIMDPKYGHKWPLVDITICSTVGSYLVVSMQGVGSAIVYSVSHPENSQMGQWPLYIMLVFVIVCGVVQIHYLNKALNLFSTAVVTPIYYVCFTTMTLITSAVLFREYSFEDVRAMITTILGFTVIVAGVLLLFQYSLKLSKRAKAAALALAEHRGSLVSTPVPLNMSQPSMTVVNAGGAIEHEFVYGGGVVEGPIKDDSWTDGSKSRPHSVSGRSGGYPPSHYLYQPNQPIPSQSYPIYVSNSTPQPTDPSFYNRSRTNSQRSNLAPGVSLAPHIPSPLNPTSSASIRTSRPPSVRSTSSDELASPDYPDASDLLSDPPRHPSRRLILGGRPHDDDNVPIIADAAPPAGSHLHHANTTPPRFEHPHVRTRSARPVLQTASVAHPSEHDGMILIEDPAAMSELQRRHSMDGVRIVSQQPPFLPTPVLLTPTTMLPSPFAPNSPALSKRDSTGSARNIRASWGLMTSGLPVDVDEE